MSAGTYAHINIEAPYTEITKTDIALIGKAIGLDYTETWSCYKGGNVHCGKCGTCVERQEALRNAGIEDKTEYSNKGVPVKSTVRFSAANIYKIVIYLLIIIP